MSVPVEPPSQGMNALRLHRQLAAIWATGPGVQRLASVNHTVIGMRMMITSFVFFAIGGILGMLTRVQLASPHAAFMDAETYNQVFTMHGSMMLFLFAIPMVESFAVYITPKILGTRDFAFPRLTAYGYWCYLFGGTILTVALIMHVAPDGGWFMYTPLSSNVYTPGINADVWLLGVTFVEISALSLAMEIVVSILKMRAPGMSLDRMPIFAWYILVTAMMMIVAFPPLILGSISSRIEPRISGGNATIIIIAVTRMYHAKIGMRSSDMPGARILRIETTISIASDSAEISTNVTPSSQTSALMPGV